MRKLAIVCLCLTGLLVEVAEVQGQYSLNCFSVEGGGGASTGGVYSVSGSVCQPDAGQLSGGTFSLDGGFLGTITPIQTPGAPRLSMGSTGTNTVVLSWPSVATGFVLQEISALGSATWEDVTNPP